MERQRKRVKADCPFTAMATATSGTDPFAQQSASEYVQCVDIYRVRHMHIGTTQQLAPAATTGRFCETDLLKTKFLQKHQVSAEAITEWCNRSPGSRNFPFHIVEPLTHTIPNEVLELIFLLCNTPTLLSAQLVCFRWFYMGRQVVKKVHLTLPVANPKHLTSEQERALRLAVERRSNLFITGEAGTGKTHLFRCIAAHFTERGIPYEVIAPTGAAAHLIHGTTIHNFLGLRGKFATATQLRSKKEYEPLGEAVTRAKYVQAILLDEISMVSLRLFEYMDLVLRTYRGSTDAFGGVQLICAGDFAQLPPVPDSDGDDEYTSDSTALYCFQSPLWSRMFGDFSDVKNKRVCYLIEQMRQSACDTKFAFVLSELRRQRPSGDTSIILQARHKDRLAITGGGQDFGGSLCIVAQRKEADVLNNRGLERAVKRDDWSFSEAMDSVNVPIAGEPRILDTSTRTQRGFYFGVGARVMLLKNYARHRLFNNAKGYVREIFHPDDNDQAFEIAARLNHPAQSQFAHTHPAGTEFRVLSDGSYRLCYQMDRPFGVCRVCYSAHQCDMQYATYFPALPVVVFDSQPNVHYLVLPAEFSVYRPVITPDPIRPNVRKREYVCVATRRQLPLTLAYATTIHSVQGLTVDRVTVSLRHSWLASMVYVAFSRVRSLDNICIESMPDWVKLYHQGQQSPQQTALFHMLRHLDAIYRHRMFKRAKAHHQAIYGKAPRKNTTLPPPPTTTTTYSPLISSTAAEPTPPSATASPRVPAHALIASVKDPAKSEMLKQLYGIDCSSSSNSTNGIKEESKE